MTDSTQIENLEASECPEELTAPEAEAALGGMPRDGIHRLDCSIRQLDPAAPCSYDTFGDDWEQVMMDLWGMQ